MTRIPRTRAVVAAGLAVFVSALWGSTIPASAQRARPAPALDRAVIADLFNGFRGDLVALQRGLDATQARIDEDADNAEALAWHGAATHIWSSLSPEPDIPTRIRLFRQANSEMARAIELEPDNLWVRMPRGVVLRILTPGMPNFNNVPGLIDTARVDYERLFDLQQDRLDQLAPHALGELLEGLGELYARQGDVEKADRYFRLIQSKSKLEGTEYATHADHWMATHTPPETNPAACVGCHTPAAD